jgi:hypothetical protein
LKDAGRVELTRIIGSLSKRLEFDSLHDGSCKGAKGLSEIMFLLWISIAGKWATGEDLQDTQAQKRRQTEFDAKFHL